MLLEMVLVACVWQLGRAEALALDVGRRWLAHGCFVLNRRASRRQKSQPPLKAQYRDTVLKGYGNPIVMRRLVESEDEEDDFLVSDAEVGEDEGVGQQVGGTPAQSHPTHTRVRTAEYISSSTKLEKCPQDGLPEFAIIGRSNVGKSSLINMLTKSKNLALTSKQPGKTRCINHFLINNSWYLVDLPGYGYAKASQEKRIEWNEFTKTFFLEREQLVTVLLLVDASVPPQRIDVECAMWLAEAKVPFSLVFTKADKAKKRTLGVEQNVSAFSHDVEVATGLQAPAFLTSAATGTGTASILRHVAILRQQYEAAREAHRVSSPLLVPQGD